MKFFVLSIIIGHHMRTAGSSQKLAEMNPISRPFAPITISLSDKPVVMG